MARLARVVAPGLPHHITQRGNRRQQTFFSDDDYRSYIDLDDKLVKVEPLLAIVQKPWAKFLSLEVTGEERQALQKHERTGCPLGSLHFVERLESKLDRALKPGKPGPKPKKQ